MPRPRLPIDEQAVLTAYQSGDTIPTIARALGVDRSRVTRVIDEAGLRRNDRGAHWAKNRPDPIPKQPRTHSGLLADHPRLRGISAIADAIDDLVRA